MTAEKVGIRFVSLAEGQTWLRIRGCPMVGQWLMSYDPDAFEGLGEARFTSDLEDALRFDTFADADAFWRQQSTVAPTTANNPSHETRENRPLMVVSVEVAPLD